jgi:2'-5' RNA ligase
LQIYEQLWAEAASAFERGSPSLDTHLLDKSKDLRRSAGLAVRPPKAVQEKISSFLEQLATIAPGQYFYRPEEFHVTVLTIISGTEFWRKEIRQLAACRAVIHEVLSRQKSFTIRFRGVTASPGAVIIQGFPTDDTLEKIRAELREAFAQTGLGDRLDRRYKINSAHITATRFCRPQTDWKRLAALLSENRETDFGEMTADRIQLLWGDWYASAETTRTLQEYPLSPH